MGSRFAISRLRESRNEYPANYEVPVCSVTQLEDALPRRSLFLDHVRRSGRILRAIEMRGFSGFPAGKCPFLDSSLLVACRLPLRLSNHVAMSATGHCHPTGRSVPSAPPQHQQQYQPQTHQPWQTHQTQQPQPQSQQQHGSPTFRYPARPAFQHSAPSPQHSAVVPQQPMGHLSGPVTPAVPPLESIKVGWPRVP